nr:choice-of-anchor J domain-containing protein [candidate division Zixibacteria bacterium]
MLTLVLALTVFMAFSLSATGNEKPIVLPSKVALNPNQEGPATHPDEAEGHVDSYVPLVEESEPPVQEPTDEELEQDRLISKVGTSAGSSQPTTGVKTGYISEGFEGGVVPPTSWSAIVNNAFTWEIDASTSYEGTYNASCYYDENYTGTQDEWLISPAIDLSGATSDLKLEFAWYGSYYWAVDPYDNYDLEVWISTDGGTTFPTKLWDEDSYGLFTNWTWYLSTVDLSAYVGESNVAIGFRYYGYDGAHFAIDAISLNDDPPPTGRCCYGDPLAPSCGDLTQADCEALGNMLSWDVDLNCTDNPCQPAGPGDNCNNPIKVTLPADMPYTDANQYTCGRGDDYAAADMCYTYGYGGGEDIVYELKVTEEVTIQMTMDPKGDTWTYVEIRTECVPPNGTCVYYFRSTAGAEYYSEAVTLAAGTYYIIIDTWPDPTCLADFDFTIDTWQPPVGRCCYDNPVQCADVTEEDCTLLGGTWDETLNCTDNPCPAAAGNDCNNPIEIKLPGDMPYANNNTTCGRGNNYDATCLGYYDGGEDIIYWLDVDSPIDVDITVDPYTTTYVGVLVSETCPPGDPCLAYKTAYSGVLELKGVHLDPGSYYIMVDTWPSPDCIPTFDLTIEESGGTNPGDLCSNPISLKLPGDLPYTTIDSTCGHDDYYSTTCLGSYDGGEDVIFELDIDTEIDLIVTLDPMGTTYTGMAISDQCPLPSSSCLVMATNSGSSVYDMSVTLSPGLYYLMIDTYPSPYCIPMFELTMDIDTSTPPPNDNCEDVTPVTLAWETTTTFTGNNTNATNQCTLLDDDGHAWEAFTITGLANVVVDYCGTDPAFELVYIVLATACPCEGGELIYADPTDWDLCGDGNVTMYFNQLQPGTYYIPVLSDHPSYPDYYYEGPYQINVWAEQTEPEYCAASGGCDEYIANVTFGEINNSSDCEGYGDFTDQTAYVAYGVGYPIAITLGTAYSSDYGAVWVDWNQDKDFLDANEEITLDVNYGVGPYTGTITVPMDAVSGATRMRVRLNYSSYPGPCGSTTYGEVEDYTLMIGGEPSVLTLDPTEIDFGVVEPATTGGTDLILGADGEFDISFEMSVAYGKKASVGGGQCLPDLKANPFQSSGHVPSLTASSKQLMFEGFETSVPPSGWTTVVNNPYTWEQDSYAPYEGLYNATCLYDETYSGTQDEWLISPAIDFGGAKYVLDFWWNGSYYWAIDPYDNYDLEVWISTDGGATFPTKLWDENSYGEFTTWEWNNSVVDLSAYKDESNVKIAFRYYGYDGAQFSVDAFAINEAPLSWLSAVPSSGTVPAGGTTTVAVNYNTADLDLGVYTADLVITHTGAKGTDIVPVTIEVGQTGNNIISIEPAPIYAFMAFGYGGDVDINVYLGGEFAGGGHVVDEIDGGTITLNGVVPDAVEQLDGYEDFTGAVMKITLNAPDFLGTYPLLWDVDDYDYTVAADFAAGGSFTEVGVVTLYGHKSGDANFDNHINILDMTYLINYLYRNGDRPQPVVQTGDANGDGAINILDATRIMNYLYRNGPAPTHP